ncbi:hypothetical protein [[Enterobacter] lignolyticus]|uniref:hypothetical protein n=1 Tax=[Enterobacter] lignolyticus TaxID=1334193 RepID=UPI0009005D33|nr:hypothetical protein [[Enterobacter] lignolyticus]
MSKLIKCISSIVLSLPLTGCVIAISPMSDYSGNDAAKIRVVNNASPLSIKFYRMSGGCLQEVDSKSLVQGINILGMKSTKSKYIEGIKQPPEDSPLRGVDVMEYNIQPGQYLEIGYRTTSQTTYTQTVHSSYRSFIPKANHSYEAYTLTGGYYIQPVMITDITEGKSTPAEVWNVKECNYTISLLGKKEYK